MINTSRIVPVQNVDLLSLYGLILRMKADQGSLAKIDAVNPGEFEASSGALLIAGEPVKSFDIKAALTSTTIYFVAAEDYKGFSLAGTPEEPADGSDAVVKDATTLYKAVLSSGDITITKVGF